MIVDKVSDCRPPTRRQRIQFSIGLTLSILGVVSLPSYSRAATSATVTAPVAPATPNPVNVGGDGPTRLVVDAGNNIIRIMIAGKEVGRFDSSGLHVEGDLTHSGMDETTPPAPASGNNHAR
jgi:hypothetical protein